MNWVDPVGLIFVTTLLVPNIIFAVFHKDGFENKFRNKAVEMLEQIGRFGSFITMFVIVRPVVFGYWLEKGRELYLIFGTVLLILYLLGWVLFRKESSVRKSLWLSIVPSLLFIESGFLRLNMPLIVFSLIFAPCHILISYKNSVL